MSSPYEPPVPVWAIVKKSLNTDQEKAFMKEILGDSLVDQTVELHAEVDNLLEIWREFRLETTSIISSTSQNPTHAHLPEPPEVRFRLKKEIQFYVEALQTKAKKEGRQLEQVLRTFNNSVLDYALEKTTKTGSRPSTGKSKRDGLETPLVEEAGCRDGVEGLRNQFQSLRTLSTEWLGSTRLGADPAVPLSESVESLAYVDIIDRLRDELTKEVKTLYGDIDFLQSCLEGESEFRCDSSMGLSKEPTLTDLKEERRKLENQLLSDGAAGDAFDTAMTSRRRQMKPGPLPPMTSTEKSKTIHGDSNTPGNPLRVLQGPQKDAWTESFEGGLTTAAKESTYSTAKSSRSSSKTRATLKNASQSSTKLSSVSNQSPTLSSSSPCLGPAASQPFGSTQRIRIRDNSPLSSATPAMNEETPPGSSGTESKQKSPKGLVVTPPTLVSPPSTNKGAPTMRKIRSDLGASSSILPSGARLVTVASLRTPTKLTSSPSSPRPVLGSTPSPDGGLDALLAPTPPPTPPVRAVTSAGASRFRRMVLDCREDSH